MSASLLHPAVFEIGLDAEAQYSPMLLEADFRMGRRGKEIPDRLVKSFGWDLNPVLSSGWFDLLETAELRALAARAAVETHWRTAARRARIGCFYTSERIDT